MRRIRSRLTYANVISTLCLFLLVGGGTAVAVTSSSGQSGNGSGAVFARMNLSSFQDDPVYGPATGIGDPVRAGASAGEVEVLSPNRPIVARDLAVRLTNPPPNASCTGAPNCSRTIVLLRNGVNTALSCTISGDQRTCNSGSKSARIPAGSRLAFKSVLVGGDTDGAGVATLGWRATIP